MPNPNEQPATPATDPTATPAAEAAPSSMNLAPEALPPVDADLLAVARAAVNGEPAPAPSETPAAETPAAETPAATDPATPAAPAETPAAAAPAAETPAAPAAKPSDEFGDLPADAKAETKQRFDKLRGAYDEKVTRLTTLETQHREAVEQVEQWRGAVIATGATPEQFGMSLQFLTDLNSGTPDGLERAWTALTGQLAEMAKAMGREVPGVFDPLAEHKDLQARIDDHMDPLTREDAVALANERNRRIALEQGQRAQATRAQETRTQQTFEQQQQTALSDIQAFGAERRANDPLYAAKMAAIGPAVKRIVAKLPPSEWVGEVKALYEETVVAAPAPAARPAAPNVPSPLRPTASPAGAGGVVKAPSSPLEAARMAIGLG